MVVWKEGPVFSLNLLGANTCRVLDIAILETRDSISLSSGCGVVSGDEL